MPRTPRRLAALLLAGATLASLAACAPADPEPTSPPPVESTTDDPIFASDEEALAAAIAGLETYAITSAEISSDQTVDPGSIRTAVSDSLAEDFIAEFEVLREANLLLTGVTRIDNAQLVQVTESAGVAEVSLYFCRDVSETRVIDSEGSDVTPASRQDRVPMQATLVSNVERSPTLILEDIQEWSGEGVC